MSSFNYLVILLRKLGHKIETREYVKPCNGYSVIYITSINGKPYHTNQQKEAKNELKRLLEVEGIND